MISALKLFLMATRRLFKQWRVMAALIAVYASLLAALLFFVATKEATIWQITLTLIFAALAPALFFILQAMIVSYARGTDKATVLLKRSLEDSCKLALASVPLALVAILLFYFLNKLQTYPAFQAPRRVSSSSQPLQWPLAALYTLRFIIFGIVLPLIAAHMWSATLECGLVSALKGMHRNVARAFAPEALRIYFTGLMLFGFIPYVLLFMHTPARASSVEFGLFITRLVLVFIFTLLGWVLTLAALVSAGNAKVTNGNVELIDGEQSLCEAER